MSSRSEVLHLNNISLIRHVLTYCLAAFAFQEPLCFLYSSAIFGSLLEGWDASDRGAHGVPA